MRQTDRQTSDRRQTKVSINSPPIRGGVNNIGCIHFVVVSLQVYGLIYTEYKDMVSHCTVLLSLLPGVIIQKYSHVASASVLASAFSFWSHTVNYIRVAQRIHGIFRTLDQLTLKLTARTILRRCYKCTE